MTDPTLLPPPTPPAPELKSRPSAARIILSIIVALVVVAGVSFATQAILRVVAPKGPVDASVEGGVEYSNADLGFSATFPGEPTVTSEVQEISGYEIEINQFQWANGADLVLVAASVYPEGALVEDDSRLANSIAGFVQSAGATVSGERDTELDGVDARRASVAFDNGSTADIVVAFVDSTQYMIMASGAHSLESVMEGFSFTP